MKRLLLLMLVSLSILAMDRKEDLALAQKHYAFDDGPVHVCFSGSEKCVNEACVQRVLDNGDVRKLLRPIVEILQVRGVRILRGPGFMDGEREESLEMSREIAIFFKPFNLDFCTLRLGDGDIE